MSDTPLFKNFGKSYSDLIEKKYTFNREFKAKTTTTNGVSFEVTGKTTNKAGDYAGSLKLTQKNDLLGALEAEFDTDARVKGSVEYGKVKNTVIKVTGDQSLNFGLDANYRTKKVAVSSGVNYSPAKTFLDASAAYGQDGISVGGAVKADALTQTISDYNGGVELAGSNYTLAVKSSDKATKVTTSLYYTVNPDITVGAAFLYSLDQPEKNNSYSIASAFNFDRDTSAKVKLSSTGTITAALEQRLANPKVKLGLTGEYGAMKDFNYAPNRFGLSLGFGDV